MFELHIQDTDVTAGAVPITWCIDKETLKTLKGMNEPLVVISIVPVVDAETNHGSLRTEQRYVVPLRDAMTYVSFKKPGPNRIFGFIDVTCGRGQAEKKYFERYDKRFDLNIVNFNGDAVARHINETVPSDFICPPVNVDVPDLAFAKEPSEFERAWVCWLIPDKGTDQCAFRRRKMFAYTIQVIIMLAKLISIMVFTLVAALIGSRGTSLKYLFHPLTYDVSGSADGLFSGGTIFFREIAKPDDGASNISAVWWLIKSVWSLPFMPPIATALWMITHFHKWPVIGLTFLGMAVFSGLLLLALSLALSGAIGEFVNHWWDRFINGGETWQDDDAQDLICDSEPKKKLAPKRRTVRLKYLALKSKVCKPFAG